MTDQPEPEVRITPDTATVRRAPKFGAFMIVGALVGLIVTLIVTSLFEVDPAVGFTALFAYFALYGVTAGIVLGAVLAIILDRVSRRRARAVAFERTTVEAAPVIAEIDEDEG